MIPGNWKSISGGKVSSLSSAEVEGKVKGWEDVKVSDKGMERAGAMYLKRGLLARARKAEMKELRKWLEEERTESSTSPCNRSVSDSKEDIRDSIASTRPSHAERVSRSCASLQGTIIQGF